MGSYWLIGLKVSHFWAGCPTKIVSIIDFCNSFLFKDLNIISVILDSAFFTSKINNFFTESFTEKSQYRYGSNMK